jgi:hypothetical protein
MQSFPSLCLRFGFARGHQRFRAKELQAMVRITTRPVNLVAGWVGDLVGKARGMHGETETFQLSAFRRSFGFF